MLKFLRSPGFAALFSGFLTAASVCYLNIVLIWVCFVPLFIFSDRLTVKNAFKVGCYFGGAVAIAGFYWMIPGAERFTGSSILYGIIVFGISGCFFSLFFGSLTCCFSLLKTGKNTRYATFANALIMASIFCIGEALLTYVSSGFPWFDFHAGYALSANLYAIQPAAFFGVHVLSFVVLLVNYLCAVYISKKKWGQLLIPLGIIVFYFLSGYLILRNFEDNFQPGKTVSIAILSENIAPEIKWNDNTGNALAEKLMNMSRQATELKPDIALWSESAIPWTYRKDDDLVNAILKITKPGNITHILGINTEAGGSDIVYNSAYCITPDGQVTGRYDKQVLLSLIEKPLDGAVIPFMSSGGFTAKTGEFSAPLNTPFGKAGIIICNESAVPETAYNAANEGAGFLCNMSNDGWFNDTYIVGLHFYNARLRAVETRKDMVVNSNNGYSGVIKASGAIAMQERSTQPLVKLVAVNENHVKTLVSHCPWLFIYFCLGVIFIACAVNCRPAKKAAQ